MACRGLDQNAIAGILQNVDSLSGQATVKMNDGSTMTFDLGQIDLSAVKAAAGSASLEVGDPVKLSLSGSGQNRQVRAAQAERLKVRGTIQSVSGQAVTITAENGVTLQVTVNAQTKIEVNDENTGTLADLQVGASVKVKYDPETNVAVKIELGDEEKGRGKSDQGKEKSRVTGEITSINAEKGTLVVLTDSGEVVTITVSSGTEIETEGADTFGSLIVGMTVKAKYDPATGIAKSIEVKEVGEKDEAGDDDQNDLEEHESDGNDKDT